MMETQTFSFATIGEIYEDGVSLIFDGTESPSEKHYKVNTSIVFSPGDRVKILSDSGTYVVEYVVGSPLKKKETLPLGDENGQVLKKNSSSDFDTSWQDTHEIPPGGANGQVLKKNSEDPYDVGWADASSGLPSGGSAGALLAKKSSTDGDVGWTTVAPYLRDLNSTSRYIGLRYVSGSGGYFEIYSSSAGWKRLTTA